MKYSISNEIGPAFDRFCNLIATFTNESFNKIPFDGSWTAGQVARHMQLSAENLGGLLSGKVSEINRDPEEKIQLIKDVFLNFETKMQSPEFIVPEPRDYVVTDMEFVFRTLKSDLIALSQSLDLSMLCEDFEVPGFGKMTRVEWLSFVVYHLQRHTVQLGKIAEIVN